MPYLKKIVILNSLKNKSDAKAVLTLTQNGVKLGCVLKTYREEFNTDLSVGIRVNGKLLSPINVIAKKASEFNFELNNSLDLTGDVCALICTVENGELTPVLYGGSEPEEVVITEFMKDYNGFGSVGVKPKTVEPAAEPVPETTQSAVDEVASSLFVSTDDEVEAEIDAALENFDVNEKPVMVSSEQANSSATKVQESDNEPIFYSLVEDQVMKMFETYPEDKELMELIANSRFAKVDFDGEGLYYSLGLIYADDGSVEKICYAVLGEPNREPPEDIKDYCFYMPATEDYGYYVLMQNAKTGENIKMLN